MKKIVPLVFAIALLACASLASAQSYTTQYLYSWMPASSYRGGQANIAHDHGGHSRQAVHPGQPEFAAPGILVSYAHVSIFRFAMVIQVCLLLSQ